jgi:serine/threonine protein kinase
MLVELDKEWHQMPVAELHQLDALCDQFELSIDRDPETRVERFLIGVPPEQQRVLMRELVSLEIEKRKSRGESLSSEEYGSRFPQWAEDLQALAAKSIEDVDRALITKRATIDQSSSSGIDTEATENDLHAQWSRQWQASSESARHFDLPSDGVLGHYRLESVIGRGGMGLVVRAHDTRLHRDVAIKFLTAAFPQDDTAYERFLCEARAAAAIRHACVVTIYAVEEIDGIPFLAMELIEGITLEEYLRDVGKVAIGEIVYLACQIAEGLEAAHKQSLIHRDIKPANILLGKIEPRVNGPTPLSNRHVKITDFGLAQVVAKPQLANSGLIAGTPQYMSPEQANGQELDARSDLFSLGSVMYAMCAGRAAFEAESAIAIARQVAEKPAPSLRDFSLETPDWLIETIEKLMAKSPDDRFQSAGELSELLDRYLHDEPSPTLFAAPRLVRQRKFAVALCALLVIAVIGFWIAQIVFRVETPHGTLTVMADDPDVQISVKSGATKPGPGGIAKWSAARRARCRGLR